MKKMMLLGGLIISVTAFSQNSVDYQEFDGVKFANNFSVSSDGQESQVVVHDIKVNEAIADKEFD